MPMIFRFASFLLTLFLMITLGSGNLFAQDTPYQDRANMVGFTLTSDQYEDPLSDWNRASLEYRRFSSAGPVILRGHTDERDDQTGYQGEIEFWPDYGENWYAHLQAAVSNGDLYADYRFGAEYYRVLPNGWEASLGARYLNFGSSDALLLTGIVSRYAGEWLFTARPYVSPQQNGRSFSGSLSARRYFGSPHNYMLIMGGYGFSVDEQRLIEGFDGNPFLESGYLSLRGNRLFAERVELFGEIKWTEQEFPFTDDRISIYTFEADSRIRF